MNIEQFELVTNHFLTQNAKSVDDNNICKYRGNNNFKCIIGKFIPDNIYNPKMEQKRFIPLIENFPETKPFLKEFMTLIPHDSILILYNYTDSKAIRTMYNKKYLLWGEVLQALHDFIDVIHWESVLKNLKKFIKD